MQKVCFFFNTKYAKGDFFFIFFFIGGLVIRTTSHYDENSRTQPRSIQNKNKRCYYCYEYGHLQSYCPYHNGGIGWRNPNAQCLLCGEYGHYARDHGGY